MINKIWTEKFGDDYHERNKLTEAQENARLTYFIMLSQMLSDGGKKALPKSILEVGAGTGHNLKALKKIIDINGLNIKLSAGEPNISTHVELHKIEGITVYDCSLPDIDSHLPPPAELVLTCGMLIHINPEDIKAAVKNIYDLAEKYILIMEYFSAEEREIKYHGEDNALWTRDYGKIFLDNHKLHCIGYGFLWKPITLFDNVTWWLFEKVH